MITMTETQRARRGHDFLPPADELAAIPKLYATEATPLENKEIVAHYFSPVGDWWVAELGQDEDEVIGFGYVKLSAFPEGAEWGYFPLRELEALNAAHGLVIVERDCYWSPRKFKDIKEAHR